MNLQLVDCLRECSIAEVLNRQAEWRRSKQVTAKPPHHAFRYKDNILWIAGIGAMANWPWCQLVLWQVSSLWNYYCGSLPLNLLAASIFRTSQPLRVGNERRKISLFRGYLEIRRSCSSKQNRSEWCLIFAFWKLECCIFQCMFLKCVLLLRIFLNLNYWRHMC